MDNYSGNIWADMQDQTRETEDKLHSLYLQAEDAELLFKCDSCPREVPAKELERNFGCCDHCSKHGELQ